MCYWVSDEIQKFSKLTKRWKVGGVNDYTGPYLGVRIVWNTWMKAEKNNKHKLGFFGFNVVRTRKLAEEFALEECNGPIYRVEVKGRYRKATSDEGRPCLLVEYIRFSKSKRVR